MTVTMAYVEGPILEIPDSVVRTAAAGGFGWGAEQVVGGFLLSAAIVLGGIWLVRQRPGIAPAVTLGAIALLVAGAAFLGGALWAQESLRLTAGDLNGQVAPGEEHSGVVALQIVKGDKVRLLLPGGPGPQRHPRPPRP